MTKREAENKLRSAAAQAETLADDIRNGKLWERELGERVANIRKELDAVRNVKGHEECGS